MRPGELAEQAARVASLAEPVRRDLYLFVSAQDEPVGRDAAAAAVGVSRNLAAHHLDRLVADGLCEVEFRRLTGRTGPGAGRPAKLYRRAELQVTVHLPERRYELAGQLLAAAVEAGSHGADVSLALAEAADRHGRQLAEHAVAPDAGVTDEHTDPRAVGLATLAAEGYEPAEHDGDIVLRNCPFHVLVREHRQLVCGMNLALLEGFVDGLGADATGWTPHLDPREDSCCVRIREQPRR